ncbi:hypothetical protein BASA81_006479 [Batrachochytrium salamandrivorans]|nr:hypothetical protein BASA81_006479 [Batrachochytrium salamandrivorans]
MPRSLLYGSALVWLVGLGMQCFAVFSPMWLVVRTELEIQQCWFGQGIWDPNFWWGSDLPKAKFKCQSSNSRGVFASYCEYDSGLCQAMERAKITSCLGIGLASLALGLVAFQTFWRRQAVSQKVVGLALGLSMLSICLGVATTMLVWSSPLYSEQHLDLLNTQLNTGPVPLHLFSCSLQTLLKSSNLPFFLTSAPMLCTFPGPSALSMMIFFLAQALGSGFLVKVMQRERRSQQRVTTNGSNRAAAEEEGQVLPQTFHDVRTYSLYGATTRRFSHYSRLGQALLVTAFPFCVVMANVGTWMSYILIGIQIVFNIHVAITPISRLAQLTADAATVRTYNATGLLFSNTSTSFGEFTILDDTLNPFNFSPMTSVYFFQQGEAYLICTVIIVAIFVLPVAKVVLWIWLFYAPTHEVTRGRWLIFLDALGKYSLANLFVMVLIVVSLTFTSNFIVIPLSHNECFLIKVRAGINAGNGWGSYMFVLMSLFSLLLGQILVQLHCFACSWEEDNRSKLASVCSPTSTLATPSTLATGAAFQSPDFMDTPFLAACSPDDEDRLPAIGTLSRAASSPLRPLSTLATSLVDLSNLVPHRNHSYDILRALSKYGSRTALRVLDNTQPVDFSPIAESGEDDYMLFGSPATTGGGDNRHVPQLHRHVEAMCDRVHSPLHGVQLKFTPFGKIVMWLLVFIVVSLMLVCQTVPLFEAHEKGIVGDFVVEARDRYTTYSLLSLVTAVADTGYEVPALELSTLFFLMTAVMPLMTALASAMLWGIPLTLEQQEFLFNWLEIASAWSSLDIMLLSLVIVRIEVANVISSLVAVAVPNLNMLIKILFPFDIVLLDIDMRLKFGFGLLVVAVIAEKVAIYFITENAVQTISERKVERFLTQLASRRSERGSEAGGNRTVNQLVAEASEGLLESDAILAFAPAGRYMSAQFPRTVYAGLPRSWWAALGVRIGLFADAREVDYFSRTGRRLNDLTTPQVRSSPRLLADPLVDSTSSVAIREHSEEEEEGVGPISF